MTLRQHLVVAHKAYPSSTVFEHLIDKTTGAAHGHWYWEGDVYEEPFDRTPIFVWTPLPAYKLRGRYVVARLLWVEANPGTYRKLVLKNTCDLHTCVSPLHWENPYRQRWWTLPCDTDASLVHDTQARVPRIHIRSGDARYMMCSIVVRNGSARVLPLGSRAVITCADCVVAWQAFGRLLDEIEPPTSTVSLEVP